MSGGSPDLTLKNRRGHLIIGAAIGTGMSANFAMRGGADFLLALNAGRLRSMGEPSVASMLALNEANAFVMAFATTEILPRATVPVIFGACTFDPRIDTGILVERIKAAGFHGVANFPTASMLSGPLRETLEREGVGHGRELAMLAQARAAGLMTLAYTHSVAEAEAAAESGADAVILGLGWNQGGALGPALHGEGRRAIEEAAIHVGHAARAAAARGAICLVEGGPIVSPRHLEELCRFVNIDGYVGGSTIDRVPLEAAIEETTAGFKTIGAPRGARSVEDMPKPVFPVTLSGRSEAIRRTRERLMRLAAGDAAVQLSVPDPAGTGPVAETLHKLSRNRHKEAIVVALGARDTEARRLDLFGQDWGGPEGRRRIGWLESVGGSLILDCAPGASSDLVREVAQAVRRGRARPIGGERGYPVDLRLIVSAGPDLAPVSGLTHLAVPRLADRPEDVAAVIETLLLFMRVRQKRPRLRLDAAAWRMLVDRVWPGDVDELRRVLETAAISAADDVMTPVEVGAMAGEPSGRSLFASERDWILDGLRRNSFHRGRTAAWLGVSRKTLYNKIRRYALDPERGDA